MIQNNNSEQYTIQKGGYVTFDALSLRQLIINRLNQQGVFTDQNFLGSNLASIIDIISYSYNTLLYYLNKTATESMFTEAQLLENINRIVKIIDYSPVGAQTSTLTFNCSANTLTQGFYTIPRYSYLLINSIPYSFNEDIVFAKTQNTITESLNELAQQKLLFQGTFKEYPIYAATGESNEILLLDVTNEVVDHFNINIYVKSFRTGIWKQYTKTTNLYLEDGYAEKYELRLNSNNRYEVKFGDNINGKQLQPGDQVAVYYLSSRGTLGQVGSNAINNNTTLNLYSTIQYNQILNDINLNNYRYIANNETTYLRFANSTSSTLFQNKETPDEIRQNAPSIYKSQYRLVTLSDYVSFVKTNFAYLFSDVKAVNNTDYVTEYLKYFYDIGLTDPTNTESALFNQIQYSDSCNFNNIYLIIVPKSVTQDDLLPAQKELIMSAINQIKIATTEISFIDPIYKAVTFGVRTNLTEPLNIGEDFFGSLIISKQTNSRRTDQAISNDVANIFKSYFNKQNLKLGQVLDLRELTQQILNVDGVESFITSNESSGEFVQGLSFFVWNPLYPENDKRVTQNSISMKYFEIPYFFNMENIESVIQVNSTTTINSISEYLT
jgi:hypothetical protein